MATTLFRALWAMALAVALAGPAAAQSNSLFTDGKLAAFASAASEVDALIRQWRPKINGAKTPAQANKFRETANAEFVAAIEKTKGISVAEYQEINRAARIDPKLRARIAKAYRKK